MAPWLTELKKASWDIDGNGSSRAAPRSNVACARIGSLPCFQVSKTRKGGPRGPAFPGRPGPPWPGTTYRFRLLLAGDGGLRLTDRLDDGAGGVGEQAELLREHLEVGQGARVFLVDPARGVGKRVGNIVELRIQALDQGGQPALGRMGTFAALAGALQTVGGDTVVDSFIAGHSG